MKSISFMAHPVSINWQVSTVLLMCECQARQLLNCCFLFLKSWVWPNWDLNLLPTISKAHAITTQPPDQWYEKSFIYFRKLKMLFNMKGSQTTFSINISNVDLRMNEQSTSEIMNKLHIKSIRPQCAYLWMTINYRINSSNLISYLPMK